jgi:hypothetical protein
MCVKNCIDWMQPAKQVLTPSCLFIQNLCMCTCMYKSIQRVSSPLRPTNVEVPSFTNMASVSSFAFREVKKRTLKCVRNGVLTYNFLCEAVKEIT